MIHNDSNEVFNAFVSFNLFVDCSLSSYSCLALRTVPAKVVGAMEACRTRFY